MMKGFEPWIMKENKLAKIEEKQNLVFDQSNLHMHCQANCYNFLTKTSRWFPETSVPPPPGYLRAQFMWY